MTPATLTLRIASISRLTGEAFLREELELYRDVLKELASTSPLAKAALSLRPKAPYREQPQGLPPRESDGKRRKQKVPAVEDRAE